MQMDSGQPPDGPPAARRSAPCAPAPRCDVYVPSFTCPICSPAGSVQPFAGGRAGGRGCRGQPE